MEENILCCSCLCAGRKMVTIDEYWKKQCFLQILNEIPMSPPLEWVRLCWECAALLTRFTAFKKQVKECYKLLNYYVEQNLNTSNLHRPPRLNVQKVLEFSLHPDPIPNDDAAIAIVKVEVDTAEPEKDVPEEDNVSTYSDHFEDDKALIEFKTVKKKKKKTAKEKKKRKKIPDEVEDLIEVVELTTEELEEERRTLRAHEDYVTAMFRCERCIVTFPNGDDLSDHIMFKHEANKGSFVCATCACSFASEAALRYHVRRHRRRYRCRACPAALPAPRAARAHARDHRPPPARAPAKRPPVNSATFPCEFCDKTFKWKTSLRKHMETHRIEAGQKRKPYCEPCRMSFATTSNLQKHVKTSSKHQIQLKLRTLSASLPGEASSPEKHAAHIEHIKRAVNSSRQRYRCAQCGKSFQWRGNLQRHQRGHQASAAGSLVCTPCNRTFSSIATYTQHMKISKRHVSEDDFKYMCSECGKKFANKTRLKDHVDWEHLKNYVHTCNVCQKVFKSHSSLYLHKQVVHRKDSAEHLCDHCGKHFPNQAKLRGHMAALHSARAPYKCVRCPARFRWSSCLSRHARRRHPAPAAEP